MNNGILEKLKTKKYELFVLTVLIVFKETQMQLYMYSKTFFYVHSLGGVSVLLLFWLRSTQLKSLMSDKLFNNMENALLFTNEMVLYFIGLYIYLYDNLIFFLNDFPTIFTVN